MFLFRGRLVDYCKLLLYDWTRLYLQLPSMLPSSPLSEVNVPDISQPHSPDLLSPPEHASHLVDASLTLSPSFNPNPNTDPMASPRGPRRKRDFRSSMKTAKETANSFFDDRGDVRGLRGSPMFAGSGFADSSSLPQMASSSWMKGSLKMVVPIHDVENPKFDAGNVPHTPISATTTTMHDPSTPPPSYGYSFHNTPLRVSPTPSPPRSMHEPDSPPLVPLTRSADIDEIAKEELVNRRKSLVTQNKMSAIYKTVDDVIMKSEDLVLFSKGKSDCLWFREMMAHILLNQGTSLITHQNDTTTAKKLPMRLADLTPKVGAEIGAALIDCLVYNSTPAAAVDEWVCRFPALGIFEKEHTWFKPMIKVVAVKLFARSFFGLLMRSYFLGLLGLLNTLSNIYSIVLLYRSEDTVGVANVYTGFVVANMMISGVVLCVVQNHRLPFGKILKEVLLGVLSVKAGVDSYRLMSGAEADHRCVFNYELESMAYRMAEMLVKSIPTSLIQLYVCLNTARSLSSATPVMVSFFLATMNTSYTSALLNFDKDTDPHCRTFNPSFYSYVPNSRSGRNFIFVSMFFITFFSTIIKTVTYIFLLSAVGATSLGVYVLLDLFLLLAYKMIRCDFRYFVAVDGLLSLFLSLFTRVQTKLLVDFCSLVHCRHNYELGGCYWSYNLLMNHLSSFVACWIYFKFRDDSNPASVLLPESLVWGTLVALEVLTVLSFTCFFGAMSATHDKSSFFSTMTGPQYCCKLFMESTREIEKIDIFDHHPSYYEKIRPIAEAWVKERWPVWRAERPDYISAKAIMAIPDEIISREERESLVRDLLLAREVDD